MSEPTQQDIDTGAGAIAIAWQRQQSGNTDSAVLADSELSSAVLAAVLPAHDARVRTDLLTELADEYESSGLHYLTVQAICTGLRRKRDAL